MEVAPAAEQELPTISANFARQYFLNQAPPEDMRDRAALDGSVDDIDDLLLGGR